MDKSHIDELNERLKNKTTLAAGSIYEMFGSKYLTTTYTEGRNPCDICAFNKCACVFNVDIPDCGNGVHFELIKDIKFALFDGFGELVDIIEYIDNTAVRTKDGQTYDMSALYSGAYSIEPMIIR